MSSPMKHTSNGTSLDNPHIQNAVQKLDGVSKKKKLRNLIDYTDMYLTIFSSQISLNVGYT